VAPDILTRLLRGEHLNMEQRAELRVWPHPPLRYAEVLCHLAHVLATESSFPRPWIAWQAGQVVQEGGVIERLGPESFRYRAQRADAIRPHVLAQTTEVQFSSAEAAAAHYLRWDLHLPGDLDGWKVVA
jgi:hypothetical protein